MTRDGAGILMCQRIDLQLMTHSTNTKYRLIKHCRRDLIQNVSSPNERNWQSISQSWRDGVSSKLPLNSGDVSWRDHEPSAERPTAVTVWSLNNTERHFTNCKINFKIFKLDVFKPLQPSAKIIPPSRDLYPQKLNPNILPQKIRDFSVFRGNFFNQG